MRYRATRGRTVWALAALATFVLLAFAACGGDDDDTSAAPAETAEPADTTATTETTEEEEGEPTLNATPSTDLCPEDGGTWVIGYDTFSDSQEFAAARWKGLQMWEDELGCIEFVKAVDNADGATALANVKTFINRDVDAVHLLQVVSDAQAGIVKALDDAGIPVMATDIIAPGAPFISGSDRGVGEQAGEALVSAYNESGQTEQPWVILGDVPVAGPEVAKRMQGAKDVLQEGLDIPDDQFLTVEVNQQTAEEAYNGARQLQGRIPDDVPVLITAVNDELALGIYQALDQAGRGRDITVVGIGGLSAGLGAVCEFDEWAGTVDYDAVGQTGYIVDELLKMINGQPVPEIFYTPTEVVDREAVQEKYPEACSS
jgi:ribose transport system substrate-binding protein